MEVKRPAYQVPGPLLESGHICLVLCFHISQSPENSTHVLTHGPFLASLKPERLLGLENEPHLHWSRIYSCWNVFLLHDCLSTHPICIVWPIWGLGFFGNILRVGCPRLGANSFTNKQHMFVLIEPFCVQQSPNCLPDSTFLANEIFNGWLLSMSLKSGMHPYFFPLIIQACLYANCHTGSFWCLTMCSFHLHHPKSQNELAATCWRPLYSHKSI